MALIRFYYDAKPHFYKQYKLDKGFTKHIIAATWALSSGLCCWHFSNKHGNGGELVWAVLGQKANGDGCSVVASLLH